MEHYTEEVKKVAKSRRARILAIFFVTLFMQNAFNADASLEFIVLLYF